MPSASSNVVATLIPGVSIELAGRDGDWKLASLTRSDGRSLLIAIEPEDNERRFDRPEDAVTFFRQKYFPLPVGEQ